MHKSPTSKLLVILSVVVAVVAAGLLLASAGPSWAQTSTTISFGKSLLQGVNLNKPTSLQFGPDGRLYVAQQDGAIRVYTIARNDPNSYSVTNTQNILAIQQIPNHNDDGTLNATVTTRQVTGIVVTGTASNPVIYVSSSDPREGGGQNGGVGDSNLDTNSGMISRLDWNGSSWVRTDLVRGLPRAERSHSPNGMQLDRATNTLYLAIGGLTNMGAPSVNFALMPEYALSAAILKLDLGAISNPPYDLPTLDDEDRPGNPEANDPFGGNDGKNQAKIVPGGPVQVYASGFRNPYDLLMARNGKMYTVDNGSNSGWGDVPVNEGPAGNCTNDPSDPGVRANDTLHLLSPGYYGGHPNPTRGNTTNTFNVSIPQSPVPVANPVECDYRAPGTKGELASFGASTNGLAEYTATNFGGAMNGDLIAAGYNNIVRRIKFNAAGDAVVSNATLFSSVGTTPLDVTAQGDGGPFPGTIWVADIAAGNIVVFEPSSSGGTCTGADDPSLDEDGDGFDNADEIDNATNPCSAADVPPDNDGDKTSDLNDPDDDNDSQLDTSDPFAVDEDNGKTTNLPVSYTWDNDGEGTVNPDGLLNLGFTGLMTNKTSNYKSLYDSANMTAGGAAGAVTVDKVPAGDALGSANSQKYGFQFGVNATSSTGKFTAHTQIVAPFAGMTPENNQSMGLLIGNGDQDNYVKVVTTANDGAGGIEFAKEVGATFTKAPTAAVPMPGPDAVDLYLAVDPAANLVGASYSVTTNGVTGPRQSVGSAMSVPAGWFGGSTNGLAVGIISTSSGPGPEFPATWGSIEVAPGGSTGDDTTAPTVTSVAPTDGATAAEATTNVTATFSEDMNASTITGTTFTLAKQGTTSTTTPVSATVSYDSATKKATLNPDTNLDPGATYTATVKGGTGGVKDTWGNALATDKTWSFTTAAAGTPVEGLKGEYYDNKDFTNLKLTRTDPTIDFNWGMGSPDPLIGPDNFSVRWSGQIKAERTETYTFYATTNDGVRLWINGQQLINGWSDGAKTKTGTIALQAGQWYPITMEHYEGLNMASAKLEYSSPSTPRQVVPSSKLSPTASPDSTAPTVSNVAPQDGATGVTVSANTEATFSEAMNATTINATTFTLTEQGSTTPIDATVSYDTQAKKATLDPSANLKAATTYTATVKGGTNGVKDLAGNALATDKVWSFTTAAGGTPVEGLKGEYYDNKDFTNLKLTRTDPTIDFNWGTGSPDPLIGPDNFSVRWSGQIKAERTETYTFYATTNDGVRLWINGQQLINGWSDGAKTKTGTIALQAGQWYPITMEHYEGVNMASAKLEYSSPSTPRQVVPSSKLSPTASPDSTAPTVSNVAPQDGATGVTVSANTEATFSEAMNATTINATTFTLTEQGSTTPIDATVSYDTQAKKATLDPSANLKAATTYTATVKGGTNGVKDLAGNALATDKVWSFTTAAGGTPVEGLKGEYYDNKDFTNLKLTRTDPTIDFNWGTGSPDPLIGPDNFSVRWSGQIKAERTETYT